MVDESPINPSSVTPRVTGKFSTPVSLGDTAEQPFSSRYSWIPSIFKVSEDGRDVQIESYISGLGPRNRFPGLYRIIEKIFLFALPHLERTTEFNYQYRDSAAGKSIHFSPLRHS